MRQGALIRTCMWRRRKIKAPESNEQTGAQSPQSSHVTNPAVNTVPSMRDHLLPAPQVYQSRHVPLHQIATATMISLGALSCSLHDPPATLSAERTSRATTDSAQRFRPGQEGDGAAVALGLVPLRHAAATEGVQEIRIWIGGGIGAESDLLRMGRRNGKTEGLWARYWKVGSIVTRPGVPPITIDSLIRHTLAGRCGPFVRSSGVEVCPLGLVPAPVWRPIWDSLSRLGIWTLPDEHTLPSDNIIIGDGWMMTVELRDGPYYRAYTYDNPNEQRGPERKAAAAVGSVANSYWKTLVAGTNYHSYRGRLDVGRPVSEMTPCGSNERWRVDWIYSPQMDSIRKLIPTTDTISRHAVYAEIRGLKTLHAMVPQLAPGFDEIVEVPVLTVLKPWDAAWCRE